MIVPKVGSLIDLGLVFRYSRFLRFGGEAHILNRASRLSFSLCTELWLKSGRAEPKCRTVVLDASATLGEGGSGLVPT